MIDLRTRDLLKSWPFLILGALAVVFVLMLLFSRKAPVIASLEPAMASPGQQITVTGDYFGRTEREGTLTIAGEIPPPSLIQSWTDQKIVFVVPEDASSGLVTVSNSQGTSTGVLFTNTQSIPTVLQAAGEPGLPLLLTAVPAEPVAGQTVTLTGRSFGTGAEASFLRVTTATPGPVLEVGPAETTSWTDRTLSFSWPAGAGPGTVVQVVTPRGESARFGLSGTGPMTFADPRTLVLDLRATFHQGPSSAVDLWGPVPDRLTDVAWTLASPSPSLVPGTRPLVFAFPAGSEGDRTASYRLTLTAWARKWDGPPAGPVAGGQDLPASDPRPKDWWAPAAGTLKTLTAKWGLDAPDPWVRIQRVQAGLAAFPFDPTNTSVPGDGRTAAAALASGRLGVWELPSLAAFLAGQSGIPCRLVSGLWLNPNGALAPRVWVETWVAGAGWVSWDPVDGNPGSLDNRHFGFAVGPAWVNRRLAGGKVIGPALPAALGTSSGEAAGPGAEPVVRWELTVGKN